MAREYWSQAADNNFLTAGNYSGDGLTSGDEIYFRVLTATVVGGDGSAIALDELSLEKECGLVGSGFVNWGSESVPCHVDSAIVKLADQCTIASFQGDVATRLLDYRQRGTLFLRAGGAAIVNYVGRGRGNTTLYASQAVTNVLWSPLSPSAELTIQTGVTITELVVQSGYVVTEGTVNLAGQVAVLGGTFTHKTAGTLARASVASGGKLVYQSSGTITRVDVFNGGILDLSTDATIASSPRALTITAMVVHPGGTLLGGSSERLTLTSALYLPGSNVVFSGAEKGTRL